jgi:hypothetical protein
MLKLEVYKKLEYLAKTTRPIQPVERVLDALIDDAFDAHVKAATARLDAKLGIKEEDNLLRKVNTDVVRAKNPPNKNKGTGKRRKTNNDA